MADTLTLARRIPNNETLPITESARREAEVIVDAAEGSRLDGFYLVINGQETRLGNSLSALIGHAIEAAANQGTVRFRTMPEEVSTTIAARELGISRPTLMKMIRTGQIPSHMVGTHTRLRYDDVMEVAERLQESSARATERVLLVSDSLNEV